MFPSPPSLSWRVSALLAILAALPVSGGDALPKAKLQRPECTVFRAGTPITIDGRLDEAAWFAAPVIGEFHFPWWKEGRKEQTRARLLWDDHNLYLAFCEDGCITARHIDQRLILTQTTASPSHDNQHSVCSLLRLDCFDGNAPHRHPRR